MRKSVALLALLIPSCAGGPEESERQLAWRYQSGIGYVHTLTMEQKSPEDFYAYAVSLHEERRHAEAATVFQTLSDTAPEPAMRANALYMKGQTLLLGADLEAAYRAFDSYQMKFPEGDLATRARQRMMDCALALAKVGKTENLLGLPILTSSKAGVDLLKNTLQRFPREDFSDDYYFRLAQFYHEQEDLDAAELELKYILADPTYKRSNSAPKALLLLGRIGLERYGGPQYDHRPLADAKRAYEQFLLDYKRYADDPEKARAAGLEDPQGMIETARQGIEVLNERLAEREYTLAEYYLDHGYPRAARVYLAYILKTYPRTTWAGRAGALVKEAEPAP